MQTRLSSGAILWGLTAVMWPSSAFAQVARPPASQPAEDEPLADDERTAAEGAPSQPRNYFALNELSAELGFESEIGRRSVRTDSTSGRQRRYAQENREYRFEETLGLSGNGHIVDERTLLYDGMIRLGLSQERYKENRPGRDFTTSPHGSILEYDLRLQAFPAGRISSTAYASQLDDRIPRPFLPSLDRRREAYGTALFYNDPRLPMRLSYDHLFDKIDSGRDWQYRDSEEQGEDALRYELTWQPTDDHSLNMQYEHERRSDRYSGTRTRFDTERNYFALTDTIQFGSDKRSRLETLVQTETENGDLARDYYEVAPLLRLQHSDTLFSTYKFQWLRQSYGDLWTQTYRGDAGLTHEWSKTLISSLGMYALKQDADENADLNEWGGLSNFAFSRENPLGLLSSNLSYVHSDSRSNDDNGHGIIFNESITFRDPLPAYLSQRNVEPWSIVVRDPRGIRVYLRGRDYVVVRFRDVTALQRIPNGLIADRQTVLVSYTYRTIDGTEVRRDRIDLRVQQDFRNGLTPYYALSWQDETVDEQRYLPYGDRDLNRHRVGFTYRRPRWSFGAEYEFNDDSIDPYTAGHFNADASLLQTARQQLSLNGRNSYFRFEGRGSLEEHYTTLLDLGLTHRSVLTRTVETNASAMYRFQNDSLFGETQGVDVTISLAYRIGEFDLLLEGEYDMLDLPGSTDNSLGVWVKLRRRIPLIGGSSQ